MASPLRTTALAAWFLAVAAGGCRSKQPAPGPGGSASARALPSAAASVREQPSALASSKPRAPAGCRVLGVRGSAAKEHAAFSGRFFGGPEWLDVPENVELSMRHSETTREFVLRGPGRFLPCNGGAEAVLIARGGVTTSTGPGARAGAEVLIGTPFASLHYSDAKLVLDVSDQKLSLRVEQGEVAIETGGTESPKALTGPKGVLALSGKVTPEALVGACTSARAAASVAAPAASGAKPALGSWAVNQLRARRSARYVCAQAEAAVGRLEGSEQSRLSGLLSGADHAGPPDGGAGK